MDDTYIESADDTVGQPNATACSAPDSTTPNPSGSRRRQPLLSLPSRIILTVAATATLIVQATTTPVPFMETTPGEAFSADSVVRVGGNADTEGELYGLTVAVSQLTAAEFAVALFDPSRDVTHIPRDFDFDAGSQDDALVSGTAAALAAYSLLDIYEPELEVSIVAVMPDGPAEKAGVNPGRLRSINGEPVASAGAAKQAITELPVGSVVSFEVETDEGAISFDVATGPHPSDPNVSWVGVLLGQQLADQPPKLPTVTPSFSGPSAGLVMALETIDQLTAGDLTGGRKVAATGAIEPDGTIRPVGGVYHKAKLAAEIGADLLLVPSHNYEEARAAVPESLEVVAVDSLTEALATLGWRPADLTDRVDRNVVETLLAGALPSGTVSDNS